MRSAELTDTTDSVETVSISVLVPSFDPGAHFEPAIRSALRQLGPHDEIVIQDAGSTDGTQDLIAALTKTDPRVKAVIEADEGHDAFLMPIPRYLDTFAAGMRRVGGRR